MIRPESGVKPTTDRPINAARPDGERFVLATTLGVLGICCATTLLAVSGSAGILAGAAAWLVGGGRLALPITVLAVVGAYRIGRQLSAG